jgi:hypothetical protein
MSSWTKQENENAQFLIDQEIRINQTSLVNELLCRQFFNDAFTHNDPEYIGAGRKVWEWWAVNYGMAQRLIKFCEPVLETSAGYWWGRRTSGHSILMDGMFQEMVRETESE